MTETPSTTVGAETECKVMLDIATPDLYRQNAFRVLNLPTTVTAEELSRRQKKLRLMEKLGAGAAESEPNCFPLDPPADGEAIRRATQRLHDPVSRLIDELFWFWPIDAEAEDDEGLRLLRAGDLAAARSFWLNWMRQNGDRGPICHNFAVLYHAQALDIELRADATARDPGTVKRLEACWSNAFLHWHIVAPQHYLWNCLNERAQHLDDPRLTGGVVRQIRKTLPQAILRINVQLAVGYAHNGKVEDAKRHLGYICRSDTFPGASAILEDELGPSFEQVSRACSNASSESKANPPQAAAIAKRLVADIQPLLTSIDALLDDVNSHRQAIHDLVSRTIRGCTIDYGNNTEEWAQCLSCSKRRGSLRPTSLLRPSLTRTLPKSAQTSSREHELQTLKEGVVSNRVTMTWSGSSGSRLHEWRVAINRAPQACTCCLGKPDSEESVSYSWTETHGLTRYQRTLSFAFPICAGVREAPNRIQL